MQSNETASCRIYATGAGMCRHLGIFGGAQQQASRPSLTGQGWWVVSTARCPACLVRLMLARAGRLTCCLVIFAPACLQPVFAMFSPLTTWERLRVHLALGDECDSRQGWEGNREIRGRQPMFSIHTSWQRPGWKEVSRLPRYLAASPSFPRVSSGRPRWPANTGSSLFLVQLT